MTTQQQINIVNAGTKILDGNHVLQLLHRELGKDDQAELMEAIKLVVQAGQKLSVIFQKPCNDIKPSVPCPQ